MAGNGKGAFDVAAVEGEDEDTTDFQAMGNDVHDVMIVGGAKGQVGCKAPVGTAPSARALGASGHAGAAMELEDEALALGLALSASETS